MSVTREYIQYYEKYKLKYNKSIILYQCGSFYEIYATESRGPKIFEIAELLNIVCTRKNKSNDVIDENNCYMIGFPIVALNKFLKILIDNYYTVVMVDQVDQYPKVKREVTNIYSSGTYIENALSPDTNNIISLYIVNEGQLNLKKLMCIGMSSIDLTTGKTIINEAYSTTDNVNNALDEAQRFILNVHPKEILIIYLNDDENNYSNDQIMLYLNIKNKNVHFYNTINKHFQKISYQNEFFEKIYKEKTMLSSLELLNLEKMLYSAVSFVYLLDYCYQHNEKCIHNILKPSIFNNNNHMMLSNNALIYLNIVDSNIYNNDSCKYKSLFDVVNNTSTAMGKRFLKEKLLMPYYNKKDITKSYDLIEKIMPIYNKIENELKGIYDIEKLFRKIIISKIQPYELYNFITSMEYSCNINNILKDIYALNMNQILLLIGEFKRIINMELLKKQNTNDFQKAELNFFNVGIYSEIDILQHQINNGIDFLQKICNKLATYIDDKNFISKKNEQTDKNSKIVIKKNERDGYYLSLTKIRSKILAEKIKDIEYLDIDDVKVFANNFEFKDLDKGYTKIFIKNIGTNMSDVVHLKEKLAEKITEKYNDLLKFIVSNYKDIIYDVIQYITYIDYVKSGAKTAKLYNYCKPIVDDENDDSYICGTNLRHPLIERIIDTEYVPHDVELGNVDRKGMIIYGLNSSGKSVYMKSIALNLILAQAGYYVAAASFKFRQYHSLYTRIDSNDDIFRGLSSFTQELLELKIILENSDKNTLVLTDELTRGTEHISSVSIVTASILKLHQLGCSFILTSHLHSIASLDCITKLNNVKCVHISVTYDEINDVIIYDRIFKDGPGDKYYGLLVAKYILGNSFIESAINIKNEITYEEPHLIPTNTSKYNSSIYIHECKLCGKQLKKFENISNLDCHHIIEQNDFVDNVSKSKSHIQKNSKSNLIVLCKSCHNKIHNNDNNIRGYVSTSKGIQIQAT